MDGEGVLNLLNLLNLLNYSNQEYALYEEAARAHSIKKVDIKNNTLFLWFDYRAIIIIG